MNNLSSFVLPIGAFTATLVSWAVLIMAQRLFRPRRVEMDTHETPLPPPHQTQLDEAVRKVRAAFGAVVATPIVLGSTFAVALSSPAAAKGWETITLFAIGGAFLWGYAIFRWRASLGRQRDLQWRFAAEDMVDRAVTGIEQRGHIVIRDFELNQAKIDYLLIGPKGVFTLQTLMHPIPAQSAQMADITVTYDGRALFFPNERDHLSIDNAKAGAEHFSKWISDQLETPVAARAIVALPGWQVKRISADGISVIHPGQLEALFQYIKARPLSAEMILQIKLQVQRHQQSPQTIEKSNDIKETTGTAF